MADFKAIADKSEASQGADEMLWLLEKVAAIEPKVIMEIGVHLGHSLKAWQDAFNPEVLIGIDNESNTVLDIYLMDELRKAKFIKGDSHDARTLAATKDYLGNRQVDFLFIDGDHSYSGVKQDYEMYKWLVRPGGIIAFHDAVIKDHPLVRVYILIKLLQGRKKIEVYSSDANGVAVLYV